MLFAFYLSFLLFLQPLLRLLLLLFLELFPLLANFLPLLDPDLGLLLHGRLLVPADLGEVSDELSLDLLLAGVNPKLLIYQVLLSVHDHLLDHVCFAVNQLALSLVFLRRNHSLAFYISKRFNQLLLLEDSFESYHILGHQLDAFLGVFDF